MKHTPPTVEQKIEIYSIALKTLELGERMCICSAIIAAQDQEHIKLYDWSNDEDAPFNVDSPFKNSVNNMEINFPEINKHKPLDKEYDEFWWGNNDEGNKIRISILKAEIKALKATLK